MSTPAPVLVVKVTEVARRLGLSQPLEEADRWTLEQAILDAQTDLEGYLGRRIIPVTYTEAVYVLGISWTGCLTHGPLIEVVSTTPEIDPDTGQPTGRTSVTYTAGLDGAADPNLAPIRRFVTAHAMYSPTVRALIARLAPGANRQVKSVSVEGQSVSYEDITPAPKAAGSKAGDRPVGSLPTFESCDEWRIKGRRAVQGPTNVTAPWPYEYRGLYSGQWQE